MGLDILDCLLGRAVFRQSSFQTAVFHQIAHGIVQQAGMLGIPDQLIGGKLAYQISKLDGSLLGVWSVIQDASVFPGQKVVHFQAVGAGKVYPVKFRIGICCIPVGDCAVKQQNITGRSDIIPVAVTQVNGAFFHQNHQQSIPIFPINAVLVITVIMSAEADGIEQIQLLSSYGIEKVF